MNNKTTIVPVQRGNTFKNSDVYVILYKAGMLGRWKVWQVLNKNKHTAKHIDAHIETLRTIYRPAKFELSKHGLARKVLGANG